MGSNEPVAAVVYGGDASPLLPGGVLQGGVGVASAAHHHVWFFVRLAVGEPHFHLWVDSLSSGSLLLS